MLVYLRDGSAQFYVLPHWDRSYRSNFLPHPVTVHWHWADQSELCQVPGRVATGVPIFKSRVWLEPEKSCRKQDSSTGSSALKADFLTTRPTRWSDSVFNDSNSYSKILCLECQSTQSCHHRAVHRMLSWQGSAVEKGPPWSPFLACYY